MMRPTLDELIIIRNETTGSQLKYVILLDKNGKEIVRVFLDLDEFTNNFIIYRGSYFKYKKFELCPFPVIHVYYGECDESLDITSRNEIWRQGK